VLSAGEPADAVRWLLAPLSLGGSVVLHAPQTPGPAGPDLDRITVQEGVTDRVG
jgi:hypothetical protein